METEVKKCGEQQKKKNPSGYEVEKRNLEPPGYTAFESENMHYKHMPSLLIS